jgi:hypothetical protein
MLPATFHSLHLRNQLMVLRQHMLLAALPEEKRDDDADDGGVERPEQKQRVLRSRRARGGWRGRVGRAIHDGSHLDECHASVGIRRLDGNRVYTRLFIDMWHVKDSAVVARHQ